MNSKTLYSEIPQDETVVMDFIEESKEQSFLKKDQKVNPLSAKFLKKICLEFGADDAGFVEISRKDLDGEHQNILNVYSGTKTIVSIIRVGNRESIQSPVLSVANEEYHRAYDDLSDIARKILRHLNEFGVRGLSVPTGFPMDMRRWPGRIWDISHKLVAVQAGMGHMGFHRMVIHPRYGNNILLGTILIDTEIDRYNQKLPDNPCINCRLCVSVCPVGAIGKDGEFNFLACASHNYHDMFGGFQYWVEGMISAKNAQVYRSQFPDDETADKWQALTCGNCYRCSYCMAVCPAGEDAENLYRPQKRTYYDQVLKPLKTKKEPVYVIKGTRAELTARKNPNKGVRYVRNTFRPRSTAGFLDGVKLTFNPLGAKGVDLTIHFEFTGKEKMSATITIANEMIDVLKGAVGKADLKIRVDSEIWIKLINEEISLFKAVVSRKLKLRGNLLRIKELKRCLV